MKSSTSKITAETRKPPIAESTVHAKHVTKFSASALAAQQNRKARLYARCKELLADNAYADLDCELAILLAILREGLREPHVAIEAFALFSNLAAGATLPMSQLELSKSYAALERSRSAGNHCTAQ